MPPDPDPQQTPETPPPVADAQSAPAEADADEALDPETAQQAIDIPGDAGGRYVPVTAVIGARKAAREAKAEAQTARTEAQAIKDRAEALERQLQEQRPFLDAAQAIVAASQMQGQTAVQPTPEEDADALEVAKDLQLYKTDGSGQYDIEAGKRMLARLDRRTESKAQAIVKPWADHSVGQQAQTMLARAKSTVLPDGTKPDDDILEHVWQQLDPRLTATPAGAREAYTSAYARTMIRKALAAGPPAAGAPPARGQNGQFQPKPTPAPLPTERAGGTERPVVLNEGDRKLAKSLGITDEDFTTSLASMPAGWGKHHG